jgi:hypothetical protein
MRIGVSLPRAIALAAFAVPVAWPAAQARAQFGYGFGLGFNQQSWQTHQLINSWALQNGAKATMGPVQNNVYAGNPNAYVNRLRDPGYLDQWDVGTRREIEASIGRFSDGPPPSYLRTVSRNTAPAPSAAPAQPATPPQTGPVVPLSSFFDRYQKLIWPSDAPVFGDLAGKRSAADLACLAVLNDYTLRGLAQVSTVTEARSKLIDYGRPALQYMRDNSTPRIADTFHLFLLSLYESLAQAATVPKAAAAPASHPQP